MGGCAHAPEDHSEPEHATRIYEADERIILRAIARVLKEQGLGEARVQAEQGRLETDYVVQGDWRTRVESRVKRLNRREREVSLRVLTEKRSAAGWQPKKLLGPEQYDRLFGQIEMQIYREWANPD